MNKKYYNARNGLMGAVAIILIIAFWAMSAGVGQPGTKESIQAGDQIKEGTNFTAYKSTPPTSGPYYPSTGSCKIYDTEQPIQELVHNLRNGNIVLLYKRAIDQTTWGKIRALDTTLVGQHEFLAAPYEDMPTLLSVVAWGWHLDLNTYDEKQIMDFYNAHKGNGVENIPCVGEPSPVPAASTISAPPGLTVVPVSPKK